MTIWFDSGARLYPSSKRVWPQLSRLINYPKNNMNKLKRYIKQFIANIFYEEIKKDSAMFLVVALNVAGQQMVATNSNWINVWQDVTIDWKRYNVKSTYVLTLKDRGE